MSYFSARASSISLVSLAEAIVRLVDMLLTYIPAESVNVTQFSQFLEKESFTEHMLNFVVGLKGLLLNFPLELAAVSPHDIFHTSHLLDPCISGALFFHIPLNLRPPITTWGCKYTIGTHGRSFATFRSVLVVPVPTVLVVRTKGGAIFGVMTYETWTRGASFFG